MHLFNTLILQNLIQTVTISGNLDEPEGGFDALAQVIVCQEVRDVYICARAGQ